MFNVLVFFVRGFAFLFAPVLTDLCFALVWYFVLAFVLLLCIFWHFALGFWIIYFFFYFDCLLKLPCVLYLGPHKRLLLKKILCINVFAAFNVCGK